MKDKIIPACQFDFSWHNDASIVVKDPTKAEQAANKNYVDSQFNCLSLSYMTLDTPQTVKAEKTFTGNVNADGGIDIPLAVGAATDTSAVNRLYAAGLAAVTDAFSVRCYPLPADCSSSNGTVFKTDKEPDSLYFNVPPNSAFTVKCGLVTDARPMHDYSGIRGWVAPLRLPSVGTKFTARFGRMTTVARMGRDRDAFTPVPDQAAGGYKIGEIIDITFDPIRDADAGGIPHSCPGDLLFRCRAETEDEDDAGPRAGDVFRYRLSRLRVRGGLRAIPGRRIRYRRQGRAVAAAWREFLPRLRQNRHGEGSPLL